MAAGLLALSLTACISPVGNEVIVGPSYQPGNISSRNSTLPQEFRRVAVLPVTGPAVDSLPSLQEVMLAELMQAGRFEVVPISSRELRSWTGRDQWMTTEALPEILVARLRDKYNCDGVLLTQVTQLQAYPPLRIGWRVALVDLYDLRALWCADEVFDAGQPEVANGARRHCAQVEIRRKAAADSRAILLSPTAFGHYSARTLLEGMPWPKAAKFLPVPADIPSTVRSPS